MMTIVLLLLFAVAAWQDTGSQACEIRGRVTDAESGQPMARALIILTKRGSSEVTAGRTDEAGLYSFKGLAAGEYGGLVEAGQFRRTHLTGSLVEPAGRAREITLRDGDVREVNVRLRRARAITVRVVDPWGDALSGLRVAVKRADGQGGMAFSSWIRTTDDHGRLRLFGLDRGSYILCVEIEALGSTHTPSPGSRRERLIGTCYPSADESQAEAVPLQGADVGELEIRMRLGRTFTVSGRVVDASGAPAAHPMVGFARFTVNSSSVTGFPVDAEGRFTLGDVQPGEYAIEASVGGPDRPEDRRPFEAAFLPIRVDGDLEGLVVSMRRGVDVSGRVTLEDPAADLPRPPGSGLMIIARLADDLLPGTGSSRFARTRLDRTFTLEGVFGTRVLAVENVPPGWYVKSIRYGEKEVFDEPVEFKGGADAPMAEIVLSNRGAVVTGRVLDDGGNPARGARVVLLRAGARAGARSVAETRVSSAGNFRAGPVRGGDYLVVALPASAPPIRFGEWDRIARLAAVAERVTLGELDERVIDLRVVAER